MKKSEKKYSLKTYTSIEDLPMRNWIKINKTGDLVHLFKVKQAISKSTAKQLVILWDRIYDEFIERFGFNETFLNHFRKQKQIANLQIKMLETGDNSIKTFIKIAELELDKIKETMIGGDILSIKRTIEKVHGLHYSIDLNTISVEEFYTHLKDLKTA